jgi:3-methyladenine DNA glycosylase Tag
MLLLEGAQAGLTGETILFRRDGYRQAFAGIRSSERGTVHG